MLTLLANASAGVSPRPMIARSRIDRVVVPLLPTMPARPANPHPEPSRAAARNRHGRHRCRSASCCRLDLWTVASRASNLAAMKRLVALGLLTLGVAVAPLGAVHAGAHRRDEFGDLGVAEPSRSWHECDGDRHLRDSRTHRGRRRALVHHRRPGHRRQRHGDRRHLQPRRWHLLDRRWYQPRLHLPVPVCRRQRQRRHLHDVGDDRHRAGHTRHAADMGRERRWPLGRAGRNDGRLVRHHSTLDPGAAAEHGCSDDGCSDDGCSDDGCSDDGCSDDGCPTAAVPTAAVPTTSPSGGQLPATGNANSWIALLAAVLVGAGVSVIAVARRGASH